MRYTAEWSEDYLNWFVWDSDRACHCGFYDTKEEAELAAEELNKTSS